MPIEGDVSTTSYVHVMHELADKSWLTSSDKAIRQGKVKRISRCEGEEMELDAREEGRVGMKE